MNEKSAILRGASTTLVPDYQDELMDLVQLEAGKTRIQAFEEVADCAPSPGTMPRPRPGPSRRSRSAGSSALTQCVESYLPKGVIGIVAVELSVCRWRSPTPCRH